MNYEEIVKQLFEYEIIEDDNYQNYVSQHREYTGSNDNLEGKDFVNNMLHNFSLEKPINDRTTLEDLNKLSNNVKKQIILCQLTLLEVCEEIYGDKKCKRLCLNTIEELLEYAKFYYENSPCSSFYKQNLTESMLIIELKKL